MLQDHEEVNPFAEKLVILLKEFNVKPDELALAIRKTMAKQEVDYTKFDTEQTITWAVDNKEAVRDEAVEKEEVLPGEETEEPYG